MNKPSCYPDSCHNCESPLCYELFTCPECEYETKLNIYDDVTNCPKCGAEIEENNGS